MKPNFKLVPLLILVFITVWFRLVHLGYSSYEADEQKALYLPRPNQTLVDFLLEQRKGPVQFLVTYLARYLSPEYENTYITRLPFAIAGILAVYFFYRLLSIHYGGKIALYGSILLSVNGLIVALTRVVQYQGFVMLFTISALYAFSLASKEERWRITGIYLGMFLWAGGMLTHYDAIFIAPFAGYLVYQWYWKWNSLEKSTKRWHLGLSIMGSFLIVASFYIPLFFSVSNATLDYWQYRVTGVSETLPPSSSIFIFRLYNPLLVLEVYFLLGILSLLKIRQNWPVVLWFLFPLVVLEGLIQEPGTHIYAYVIPATILAGFGVQVIKEIYNKTLKRLIPNKPVRSTLFLFLLLVLFGGLTSLSQVMFIDHPPEYPWETKIFLIAKIGGLHKSDYKVWTYGFPYNRHWLEIRDYIMANNPNGYYSTNEDKSLTTYYIPQVNSVELSGYYIHVHHPMDLKEAIAKPKINYWMSKYPPVKVFMNEDVVVSEIYRMPPGTLEEIIRRGY